MITITNGVEEFAVKEELTKKVKRGFIISPCREFWYLELVVEKDIEKERYVRIVKKFPPSSGDELKSYYNLNDEIGKIVLSNEDYEEVKRLYDNMQIVDDKRKEAVIKAVSTLFAYECYDNYCLEEIEEVNVEDIYLEISSALASYNECITYKEEIYDTTKKTLKDVYKIDLDKLFDGGKS